MSDPINYLKSLFDSGENKESFDQKLTDFFPALIYIYDYNNKKLKFINRKLTEFLGFSFEDIKENDFDKLVFKDDLELVNRELEKFNALSDADSYSYNCRLNHKQGYWRHFRTLGSVLRRAEDGKPASLLFIAQDITDQLKSEEEIKATQDLFNETEELLQFGSWSWDAKTDKISLTKGFARLLEYDNSKEMSRNFYMQHVIPEDIATLKKVIATAVANKIDFDCEYQIETKSGVTRTVSTKGKVVTDENGEVQKILGITRDITMSKEFERERERNIRDLSRSNQELEEFAYVASHDLQEPLRKISTFTERLKAKLVNHVEKDGGLYIDRIQASTENMRILIDNLLEFSRISRSPQSLTLVDLNVVVKKVIADLDLQIEETKTKISVAQLPKIEASETEMSQLFNNLISNAIKFRRTDVDSFIEIGCSKLEKKEKEFHHLPPEKVFFKISVKDNGIGFEEEYAVKIFQIFQRLHGKSEFPGSGIGLAICKKISDNHSGIIYAEGDLKRGAVFYIILPEKQF